MAMTVSEYVEKTNDILKETKELAEEIASKAQSVIDGDSEMEEFIATVSDKGEIIKSS